MNPQQQESYSAMVRRINSMTKEEIARLITNDQCPFEPEHMIDIPIGMFHCDVCGEMVIAGFTHPRGEGKA